MSKKTEHVFAVIEKTLADRAFQSGRDKAALLRAFKAVAGEYGVNESTVRDKCTRQLKYSTDGFFAAIVAFADGKDDDDSPVCEGLALYRIPCDKIGKPDTKLDDYAQPLLAQISP